MSSIEEQAANQDLESQSRMSFGPAPSRRSQYATSHYEDMLAPRKDSLDSHFTSVSQRKPANASYSNANPSSAQSRRSVISISDPPNVSNRIALDLLTMMKSGPVPSTLERPHSNLGLSHIEALILRSSEPVDISETDEIEVLGERGIWANKQEIVNWRGVIPISEYLINEDANPEVITKRSNQRIEYIQELAVRYLRPPTPPAPGEIVITQEANVLTPPAPPLVIRQQPARPATPEPLVIREAPPPAPLPVGRKLITISGKRIPPPPRKVVIERFAPLPAKPQSVLIERWLPYAEVKRRVIFQAAPPDPVVVKPRNTIVQWEAPKVHVRKDYKYLGIVKANPAEYVNTYGTSLRNVAELPDFVFDIKHPEGIVLAADYRAPGLHELEGDLHALKLINLEQEGLGAYKGYLARLGVLENSAVQVIQASASFGNSAPTTSASTLASGDDDALNSLITQIFHTIDRNNHGRINVEDAEKTLLRLNSRLGRNYGENDVRAFFGALDANNDGTLDLNEFKRAFLNITA